jgi:hypothetical protein
VPKLTPEEIAALRAERAERNKREWIKEEVVEGGRDPHEVRQEADEIEWQ